MVFNNNICNSCGSEIVWWNPKTGNPEFHPITHNKMPFNPTEGLHKCLADTGKYFPKRPRGERITDW